jgi:hypothetical protein
MKHLTVVGVLAVVLAVAGFGCSGGGSSDGGIVPPPPPPPPANIAGTWHWAAALDNPRTDVCHHDDGSQFNFPYGFVIFLTMHVTQTGTSFTGYADETFGGTMSFTISGTVAGQTANGTLVLKGLGSGGTVLYTENFTYSAAISGDSMTITPTLLDGDGYTCTCKGYWTATRM